MLCRLFPQQVEALANKINEKIEEKAVERREEGKAEADKGAEARRGDGGFDAGD